MSASKQTPISINMVMEAVKGKVALVTGAASGMGLQYVRELLNNEAKGVTMVDVNPELGKAALDDIKRDFGPDKAIFVKTDVSNYEEFDNAFKKTLDKFGNIDILINNAAIMADNVWEKQIAVNVNGIVHGMLLGLENYIPKYRQSQEGVIVNISSVAGISKSAIFLPVYAGTKFAVTGMTFGWGKPLVYDRTKVRVFAVCPGATDTALLDLTGKGLREDYVKPLSEALKDIKYQDPSHVPKEVLKLIATAENGSVWVVEDGESAFEYNPPDYKTFKK